MQSELSEAVLEATLAAIAILDFEGVFLFTNKVLVNLSGYSKEELVGEPIHKNCAESYFVSHLMESAREDRRIANLKAALMPCEIRCSDLQR
ncbi:MAG: PAS domain S-box protein [Candidatus Heimdallarchaeota archaeon]